MKPELILLAAEATTEAANTSSSGGDFAFSSVVFIVGALILVIALFTILYFLFFKKKGKSVHGVEDKKGKIEVKNHSKKKPISSNLAKSSKDQASKNRSGKKQPFSDLDDDTLPDKSKKKSKKGKKESTKSISTQKDSKKMAYKPITAPSISDDKPREFSVDYNVKDSVESREQLHDLQMEEMRNRISSLQTDTIKEPIVDSEPDNSPKEVIEEKVPEIFETDIREEQPIVKEIIPEIEEVIEEKPKFTEDDIPDNTNLIDSNIKFGNKVYEPKFTKQEDRFGNRNILVGIDVNLSSDLTKSDILNQDELDDIDIVSAGDVVPVKASAEFKCKLPVKYAVSLSHDFSTSFDLTGVSGIVSGDLYHGVQMNFKAKSSFVIPEISIEYGFDTSSNGKYLILLLKVS